MTDPGAGGLATVFDRYPFNSPWVRGLIGRYWLQAWFAIETVLAEAERARVIESEVLGACDGAAARTA